MSHFYSRIEGARGPATRAGSKQSGIDATIRTWSGNLETRLYHTGGRDRAKVYLIPEHSSGGRLLGSFDFNAALDALQAQDKRTIQALDAIGAAFDRLDRAARAHQAR